MNSKTRWTGEAFDKFLASLDTAERNYFTVCTDLFTDDPKNLDLSGRPSLSNQLQNTVVLNLERTFSRLDFGISSASDSWDLHIASLPFFTRQLFSASNDNGYQVSPSSTLPRTVSFGGLTAWGALPGLAHFSRVRRSIRLLWTYSLFCSPSGQKPRRLLFQGCIMRF
jgi:hypothetical protein